MSYSVLSRVAGVFLACLACTSVAAEPDAATLEKGKAIFLTEAVPACAVCHTLEDAGATGAIGPNLDELKPGYAHVRKMVTEGAGTMPAFAASLDEAAIDAVSAYVSHVTGGGE
ncbi:c-type cytochrome [Allopusillimonas ginsengisoli]|uniref:SorU family sulfite dehydrogenase c-type cytochrome subunit n=1 Tax=Allopusillimonas ginsengisoli TaxID=453575 RepID=UPI00101F8D18|nr:cytochrome c [Allopusillimonas ginsengisoli]TEA80129.1 cytochrome c [Allopusillimonas ginsengisoli]